MSSVLKGCACKTRDLRLSTDDDMRSWTHREDIIDEQGVKNFPTVMVAPYPSYAIVDTEKYITLSFERTAEFARALVLAEVS